MDDDFVKQRLKRDIAELKRMCDDHFKQRSEDDDKIKDLEERITETRKNREESKAIRIRVSTFLESLSSKPLCRQQNEQEKNERLEQLKQQALQEEADKAASAKAHQAEILAAMAGGYDKAAARARRGEKRRLKRRSDVFGKKT